jgi:Tol biopolymer transport system component
MPFSDSNLLARHLKAAGKQIGAPWLGWHHRAHVVEYGNPAALKDLQETDSRVMYAPSLAKPETGYLIYVRAGNLLAQPFDPRSLMVYGEPLPIASSIYSFFPTGAADFSTSNNGLLAYQRYLSRSQLAWVNRRGEVVRTIGPANVNLKHGRLSPDGKKVATAIFDLNRGVFDIWVIDLESGASRRAIVGRRLVTNPVWAPDSQRLVFNGAYDSPPKLFLRGIGENDAVESLPTGDFQMPSDWSSDGRYIAYTNTSFAQVQNEMRGSVWLIDTARGRNVVPLLNTTFHETAPAFSPDCRWLAFTSNESGRTEVYLQAFATGESPRLIRERHLVSRQGAVSLRWRRDGKELFYLALDGRLYAVPITLGSKPKIGKATSLFAIGTEARLAIHDTEGFDVSLDGKEFLVPITTSSEHSEIVVVQNWEAEALRKHGKLN